MQLSTIIRQLSTAFAIIRENFHRCPIVLQLFIRLSPPETMPRHLTLTKYYPSFQKIPPPRYQRGAYFCEYAVFKDLCRVTIRSISRAGGCAYLCLFSLTVLEQRSIRSQTLSKAMDSLCQAITTTLRKGDVFCRYSSEQYLLLLPVDEDNSQERAKQAVRRIMKQYRDLYPRNDLLLEYSLKQLDDDL